MNKLIAALIICLLGFGTAAHQVYHQAQKQEEYASLDHICIINDTTLCGFNFNYRLKEGKWTESSSRGKTINGVVRTAYGIPYIWAFVISESGDDWSSLEENHILHLFSGSGHSKVLGDFKSELEQKKGEFKLKIILEKRGETLELSEMGANLINK